MAATRPPLRRLLISPHPDDVVWSCGGMLGSWAARDDVTVATVFDGDPPPGVACSGATQAQRRGEDAAALAIWPVRAVSLGLAEARHRGGGRYYPGPMSRRRAICPDDRPAIAAVARALERLVGEADAVLLPLGVRSHVDHEIARAAVEACVARALRPPEVSYYLEFPYREMPAATGALAVREHPADSALWLRSALMYASQVDALFHGAEAFTSALTAHGRSAQGGWVWREWTAPGDARRDDDAQPAAPSSDRRST